MATVILQARIGSTRLPGKALMPILGKPMLFYTVETLKKSPAADRIVLAIPDNPKDDPLVALSREWGIDCFRGSEPDVLERCYLASLQFKDKYYFRATGDNPVLDYSNLRRLLAVLEDKNNPGTTKNSYDYVVEKGLPLGAGVEAFTFEALERCYNEAHAQDDREHVTLYMKKSGTFNALRIDAPPGFRYPGLRLTVDYPEDFQRAVAIIENLYADRSIPPFEKVIEFCKRNGWV